MPNRARGCGTSASDIAPFRLWRKADSTPIANHSRDGFVVRPRRIVRSTIDRAIQQQARARCARLGGRIRRQRAPGHPLIETQQVACDDVLER